MAEQNVSAIVDKVWGLCNVLRDSGVSYEGEQETEDLVYNRKDF